MLDVLEAEDLAANAGARGRELLEGLRALSGRDPIVGDIRGMGLFLGVEFVADPAISQRPDADQAGPLPDADAAAYVVARLKEEGILAGTDGPDHNVVKLRGPLVVEAADVVRFLSVWERVIEEPFLAARRR
jgi:4-aminobutyrate aminotransferase-like enzyme